VNVSSGIGIPGLSRRCRLNVRPRTTAGLWSPVLSVRSTLATPPLSRFDTCTMAPETRPLPAIKRAHPPGAHDDDQLSSSVRRGRGGGVIPWPVVQGPIGHCASAVSLPLPSPGRFAMFRACRRQLCDRPQAAMGPGIAHPLVPTPTIQLQLHQRYVLGRNRESRSRPWNFNSRPGMRFLGN